MRIASVAIACVLATALGGCAIIANPNAWPQKFNYGDSANLASGANVRYVNEREREMTGREDRPLPTMCTEPAPDVAIAFGTSLQASANITGKGTGGAGANTSEAALALAGRTAGVLALRDGLYATCQAYNNGALGQSAYALGLSQYGNLLVALTAHDAGAVGGTSVTISAPPVNIVIPPAAENEDDNPGTQKLPTRLADAGDNGHLPLLRVAGTSQPAAAANPKQSAAPLKQSANPGDPAIFTPAQSAATALMVACISEYDPTRIGARAANGEPAHSGVLSESFCNDYLRTLGHKLTVATAASPK
jgi:hypothetical protein